MIRIMASKEYERSLREKIKALGMALGFEVAEKWTPELKLRLREFFVEEAWTEVGLATDVVPIF